MRKPDPEVLLRITRDFSVDFRKTVYIGDSLMKDVHMAQSAGAIDVYARYGDTRDSAAYALLREVSHWSDEEIQRDRMTTLRTVCPSYSVASFCEILKLFSFGPRT